MKNGKLQCAVIGTGMGRYHMEGFAAHPKAELVAVCDLNEAEAKQFADQYGATHVYGDWQKMLTEMGPELDVLGIAVPNFLHAPLSIAGLQAGLNVLCEKPMATKLADAKKMVAAAEKSGKRLMIDMSQRFCPAQRALKETAAKKIVGDIYYAKSSWIRRKGTPVLDFAPGGSMGRGPWFVDASKAGGGALMDIGVHLYDLAWWAIGGPKPVQVLASTYNVLSQPRFRKAGVFADVDDLASALIQFDNGATMFLEISWDAHMEPGSYVEVFGSKGGIRWVGNDVTLFTDDKAGQPTQAAVPPASPESAYAHFLDCCLKPRKAMIASAQECIEVMKVLDAIGRSAASGKAVRIAN
jgi:predicted dehydrogenase